MRIIKSKQQFAAVNKNVDVENKARRIYANFHLLKQILHQSLLIMMVTLPAGQF